MEEGMNGCSLLTAIRNEGMMGHRMMEPPFQWSHKGSDTALVFIGTRDDFKIHGVKLMELHEFCNKHLFMGMIRSIPLFKKPGEPIYGSCVTCGYFKKGEVKMYRCHCGKCPSAGGHFLKVD